MKRRAVCNRNGFITFCDHRSMKRNNYYCVRWLYILFTLLVKNQMDCYCNCIVKLPACCVCWACFADSFLYTQKKMTRQNALDSYCLLHTHNKITDCYKDDDNNVSFTIFKPNRPLFSLDQHDKKLGLKNSNKC